MFVEVEPYERHEQWWVEWLSVFGCEGCSCSTCRPQVIFNGYLFLGWLIAAGVLCVYKAGYIVIIPYILAVLLLFFAFNVARILNTSRVSVHALVQYFNICCTCLVLYLLEGFYNISKDDYNILPVYICSIVIGTITLYLFIVALCNEGLFNAILKILYIFPKASAQRSSVIERPSSNSCCSFFTGLQFQKILWWARIYVSSAGLGIVANWVVLNNPKDPNDAESIALRAFVAAGFCEEFVKFLFTGAVWTIVKYSNSREAVLQLSVASAAAFSIFEDVIYVLHSATDGDNVLAVRLVFFPLHICFNLALALGVSRQRPTCCWVFEMVLCVIISVGMHGLYDFFLFTEDSNFFMIAIVALAPLTCICGGLIWKWGLGHLGTYPEPEHYPQENAFVAQIADQLALQQAMQASAQEAEMQTIIRNLPGEQNAGDPLFNAAIKASLEAQNASQDQKRDPQQGVRDSQVSLGIADVPPGWEEKVDTATESVYYIDHVNKISQYNRPSAGTLPEFWEMKIKANGTAYFIDPNGLIKDHVDVPETVQLPPLAENV